MPTGEVKAHLEAPPTPQDLAARDLRDRIAFHEHRYHVLEAPLISAEEYWSLRRELAELEEKQGVRVRADSASLRAPAPARASFLELPHREPSSAPLRIRTQEDLRAFADATLGGHPGARFVGQSWLSGPEVLLHYAEGVLERALLWGDGLQGEDVTDNLRTIGSIPLLVRPAGSFTESRVNPLSEPAAGPPTLAPVPPAPPDFVVRGVVTLRNLDLGRMERRRIDAGAPPFLQPEAALAALVRSLNPAFTASEPLRFFALGLTTGQPRGMRDHWTLLGALKSWGFLVPPILRRLSSLAEVLQFVNALQKRRPWLEYPIEGAHLVVDEQRKPDRLSLGEEEASVARVASLPFVNLGRRAVVTKIYRAVGRAGALFPVALLEKAAGEKGEVPPGVPVPAASATEMLDIAVGSKVKALPGAVAPLIELRARGSGVSEDDASCPACRSLLVHPPDEPFRYCPNAECRGRLRARLLHLVGPRGLALKSLSPQDADRLAQARVVTLDDLLLLAEANLEALLPGKGAQVRRELSQVRSLPLWRVLHLCSVPDVGEVEARLVAAAVRDVPGLLALRNRGPFLVPGLGPKGEAGLAAWLEREAMGTLLRLREAGIEILDDAESFAAPFAHVSVVLGGELRSDLRDHLVEELERRGARLKNETSRTTDLVIADRSAETQIAEAQAYGVPVVDPDTVLSFVAT